MSNFSTALAGERRVGGSPCAVELIRKLLPKAEQADFEKALADNLVSAAAIARAAVKVLNHAGHDDLPVKPAGIQRHRRSDCGCAR